MLPWEILKIKCSGTQSGAFWVPKLKKLTAEVDSRMNKVSGRATPAHYQESYPGIIDIVSID